MRRLGYVVTRTNPPSPSYPVPSPRIGGDGASLSFYRRLSSIFSLFTTSVLRFWRRSVDWWRPLRISRWIHHDKSYSWVHSTLLEPFNNEFCVGNVLKSLRVIPTGHSVAPHSSRATPVAPSSPYKIFYNMYKPSTNFRKTTPPQPDFQIVVIK